MPAVRKASVVTIVALNLKAPQQMVGFINDLPESKVGAEVDLTGGALGSYFNICVILLNFLKHPFHVDLTLKYPIHQFKNILSRFMYLW